VGREEITRTGGRGIPWSHFFDKELLSGHDVHSCSAQSLSSFSRLIVCVGYLQSTSLLGQNSQAINMNHNLSAMTETLLQGHRYHQHITITSGLDIFQENSVEWSSKRAAWISSSDRGIQEDGEGWSKNGERRFGDLTQGEWAIYFIAGLWKSTNVIKELGSNKDIFGIFSLWRKTDLTKSLRLKWRFGNKNDNMKCGRECLFRNRRPESCFQTGFVEN